MFNRFATGHKYNHDQTTVAEMVTNEKINILFV